MVDPMSETRSIRVYVPKDEVFSIVKTETFSANTLQNVLHAVVPALAAAIVDKNLGFAYFTAIDSLFNEVVNTPPSPQKDVLPGIVKTISDAREDVLRFKTPAMFESKHNFTLLPIL